MATAESAAQHCSRGRGLQISELTRFRRRGREAVRTLCRGCGRCAAVVIGEHCEEHRLERLTPRVPHPQTSAVVFTNEGLEGAGESDAQLIRWKSQ